MSLRRVNHVVLSVSGLEASTVFYRDVLGLDLVATLPGQDNWPEMRFFRAAGGSGNHHDLAIIANASLPLPGFGQPRAPGLFHVALEVGTIAELQAAALRLGDVGALMDCIDQPMHLSVYARDPDGIALEIIWRVPGSGWTYQDLWRKPLDFDAAIARWGADLATGSAAGEAA